MRTKVAATALLASLTVMGCARNGSSNDDGTGAAPQAAPSCPEPAQGNRFSLCGTLAAARSDGVTVNGRRVLGSLEGTPEIAGRRFVVKGATFNAYR